MHVVFEGWRVIVLESHVLISLSFRAEPTCVITPVPPTQVLPGAIGDAGARQIRLLTSRGV